MAGMLPPPGIFRVKLAIRIFLSLHCDCCVVSRVHGGVTGWLFSKMISRVRDGDVFLPSPRPSGGHFFIAHRPQHSAALHAGLLSLAPYRSGDKANRTPSHPLLRKSVSSLVEKLCLVPC